PPFVGRRPRRGHRGLGSTRTGVPYRGSPPPPSESRGAIAATGAPPTPAPPVTDSGAAGAAPPDELAAQVAGTDKPPSRPAPPRPAEIPPPAPPKPPIPAPSAGPPAAAAAGAAAPSPLVRPGLPIMPRNGDISPENCPRLCIGAEKPPIAGCAKPCNTLGMVPISCGPIDSIACASMPPGSWAACVPAVDAFCAASPAAVPLACANEAACPAKPAGLAVGAGGINGTSEAVTPAASA